MVYDLAAVNGDVHVHGDGRPMYTLEVHRAKVAPPLEWLLALPSRLLDARHEVIPFAWREAELENLTRWRDSPARLSVLFLHGPTSADLEPLFAALRADAQGAPDAVLDLPNMPLDAESERSETTSTRSQSLILDHIRSPS